MNDYIELAYIAKNWNFGQKIYSVQYTSNMFRKKLSMKDENGHTWWRYEKDVREYIIKEFTYVGKRVEVDFGETHNDDRELLDFNMLFFRDEEDGLVKAVYGSFPGRLSEEGTFDNMEDALEFVEKLKKRDENANCPIY